MGLWIPKLMDRDWNGMTKWDRIKFPLQDVKWMAGGGGGYFGSG